MLKRSRLVASVILTLVMFMAFPVATPAEARSTAKLTFQTQSKSVDTPCGTYSFRVKIPVLSGSTVANRRLVSTWSDFIRKDLSRELSSKEACSWESQINLETVTQGSIYQGRYLSVVMRWRLDVTGNLKTLNLDLATGKTVGLGTFVTNKGGVFTTAMCNAFAKSDAWAVDYFCPEEGKGQSLAGWKVSTSGIAVYGEGDDSYFYSTNIGWANIVSPRYAKAKKRVTKKVPHTISGICVPSKSTASVRVQGNLVTVSNSFENAKYYGARSATKRSGKRWAVTVYNPGYYSASGDLTRATVLFSSKKGSKAVKVLFTTTCAD